ncbi:MAG: SMI1/KNR4 family protein [bacterium]|nr:SMI1/KNR4 family protein [bacterium]
MTSIPNQPEIEGFLAACPKNVPQSFVAFHRQHGAVKMDIESIGSGLVWMWPLRDVLQFSHEYGFDEFAPGLLGFGTDGCGELYAIDVRENGTGAVGDVPATSPQWDDFRELSSSFDAFTDKLMAGSPIIEPDDVDASSQ